MQHKILSFLEENKQLVNHVKHLEDELAKTNRLVKKLKSLLTRYMLERQGNFPTNESSHSSYFPNQRGVREDNVALALAEDKKKEANFTNHKYA